MTTKTGIKTIDVNALEWFDKVNGNSYFAGTVTLDFGTPDEVSFTLPFQYGYGDQYLTEAMIQLVERGYIQAEKYPYGGYPPLWSYCRENGIILRKSKQADRRKRELKAI